MMICPLIESLGNRHGPLYVEQVLATQLKSVTYQRQVTKPKEFEKHIKEMKIVRYYDEHLVY